MIRIWVILLVSAIVVFSQVEASTTTVSGETTTGSEITGETTTGPEDPNFDKDEDDDDDEEKRCRKYEEKEKYDDGKDDDDDDDDHKHHRKRCGKRKTARLLFWIGVLVVVVITGVGITICVVRYKKKRALQVNQFKSTLHKKPPEKSVVYLVSESGYNQQNTVPGPIVSTEPLPGKQ